MIAHQPLSRSAISTLVSGLLEVFALPSLINARSLFDHAIREIRQLFVKSNICFDVVDKYIDDVFVLIKTISPRDSIELFYCALIVIGKLLGIYEFFQSYTHNKHLGEKFLELSSVCKQRIFKRRSELYKALEDC